jgi:CBS domain-containing protein
VIGLKIPLENLILSFLASKPLIYAKPYQTVEEAADIMRKYNIRRLPIVDKDKIVGLVTARDLAILLSPMPEILVCENSTSIDIARIILSE